MFGMNDLVETVKALQQAPILKYISSPLVGKRARGDDDGKMRLRGEKVHERTMTLVGWSGAAFGDQSTTGRCRLRYVIGLAPSALRVPRHIIQWTSKFTLKLVRGSLGGEVCAFSEMVDHTTMLREVYAQFTYLSPGMAGLQDCESFFARLRKKKIISEMFSVRRALAFRRAVETQELGNFSGFQDWEIQPAA